MVGGLARLAIRSQMPATHGPARASVRDVARLEAAVTKSVGTEELDPQFEPESGKIRARRERMITQPAPSPATRHPDDGLQRSEKRCPGAEDDGLTVRQLETKTLHGGHQRRDFWLRPWLGHHADYFVASRLNAADQGVASCRNFVVGIPSSRISRLSRTRSMSARVDMTSHGNKI